MADKRQEITAAAQKYIQKGSLRKAIREYQRLMELDPDDVRLLLKIGDLQSRDGQLSEAVETYNRVADHYVRDGFFLKAVAVYKQLQRLVPTDTAVQLRLADLYFRLSLLSDAITYYEQVAQQYLTEGKISEYTRTLEKMVQVDPDKVGNRIKLGEQYSKDERAEDAVAQFSVACDLLFKAGRYEDYVKVVERFLFHRPEDAERLMQLAGVLLDQGQAKRALGRIQTVFKLNPRNTRALDLLVTALQKLGESERAVTVLRELAHTYTHEGAEDARVFAWQKLLELRPEDPEAGRALAASKGEAATPDAPAPVGTGPESAAAAEPGPAAPAMSDEQRTTEVTRLLAETDVYLKYGLAKKATDHLAQILRLEPGNIAALERRSGMLSTKGDNAGAAADLRRIAELLRSGDPDAAIARAKEALALLPGDAESQALIESLTQRAAKPAPAASPAHRSGQEDHVPELASGDYLTVDGGHPEPPEEEPHSSDAGFDEFDALFDAVGAEHPDESRGNKSLVQDVLFLSGVNEVVVPSGAHSPAKPASEEVVALESDDFMPEELEEALGEVDFYISQGLVEDARASLLELLGEHPAHANVLLKKIDELTLAAGSPATSSGGFDREEGGTRVAPKPNLDAAVAQVAAVADDVAFIDDGDSEDTEARPLPVIDDEPVAPTLAGPPSRPAMPGEAPGEHVDAPLGRASSAMQVLFSGSQQMLETEPDHPLSEAIRQRLDGAGMFAMNEFPMHLDGPHALVAAYELALCNIEMGLYMESADALSALLDAPGLTPGDRLLFKYYRGIAYEALDDGERARELFADVGRARPDLFPDALLRAARLS